MNIYTHFCIFMQNVPRSVSLLLKNNFTAKGVKAAIWVVYVNVTRHAERCAIIALRLT